MAGQKRTPPRNIDGIVAPLPKRKRMTMGRKTYIGLVAGGVVLLALSVTAFALTRTDRADDPATTTNAAALKAVISKHMVLPDDEEPALATVTDKAKVTSSLGDKAENGDRILIYQNNKRAILYRPSIDRIVDVVPVSIDTPPQTKQ